MNQTTRSSVSKFSKYAWGVLAYNLAVILWGAYVRATGSGAGCGSHWPLCNGAVLPRAPRVDTIIEFAHRMSSGLAFLLVLGMFIWARRIYQENASVRRSAKWAMILMITESLAGASLVIFHWVAGDTSLGRVIIMGVHLLNTHLLIGAIVLTAWWSARAERTTTRWNKFHWALAIALLATLMMSMAGAVTALGDTLFPTDSLAEGLQQDFSPTAHFIIRLRVLHPSIAVGVGLYITFVAGIIIMETQKGQFVRELARGLIVIYAIQLLAGLVNLLLLAPIWMQIIHLFLADLTWVALVLLMNEKSKDGI